MEAAGGEAIRKKYARGRLKKGGKSGVTLRMGDKKHGRGRRNKRDEAEKKNDKKLSGM